MEQRLRVTDGPDKGQSYDLSEPGSKNIGRSHQHSEICLHDLGLSRIHCEVNVGVDGVVVTDMDSETGTFVNGERVTQQLLHHGDVIRIGQTQLIFQSIDPNRPKSAPALNVAGADTVKSKGPPTATAPAPPRPKSSPSTPPVTVGHAPLPAERLAELAGTTLGHYELGPVAGKGHCGVVFRARDRKADKVVALKVLHADFPKNEEEMQRFLQGMKAVLPVRHPHLVTTFGVGRSAPYVWIALEHVEGENLAQVIQRGVLSGKADWQQAFRLAVYGARALYAAHHHNLIHRNITPQNILWRSADNLIKLADLGMAKALAGSLLRQTAMRSKVQDELVYLPPEQTHPNATLDARSDIYSLGASVYALLTGQPPFVGKTSAETVNMIREAEPVLPGDAASPVPDAFEGAILKMLAKRPENRFQTAAELLAELARVSPDPV
jgi:serine/threonine protein kinase